MGEHRKAALDAEVEALIAGADAGVRETVQRVREVVRGSIPDAIEEPDPSAKLIGYTYQPGTYKGLIVAIAPHSSHVNLMFSKGSGPPHATLLTHPGDPRVRRPGAAPRSAAGAR